METECINLKRRSARRERPLRGRQGPRSGRLVATYPELDRRAGERPGRPWAEIESNAGPRETERCGARAGYTPCRVVPCVSVGTIVCQGGFSSGKTGRFDPYFWIRSLVFDGRA